MTNLGQMFQNFTKEAFRLEILPEYKVQEEKKHYEDFLQGKLFSPVEGFLQWCEFLQNCKNSNRKVTRIHVVEDTITPYFKYQLEWGYLQSAKEGENIHLVRRSEHKNYISNLGIERDFWMFDQSVVFFMNYDKNGNFLNFEEIKEKEKIRKCIKIMDGLKEKIIPLSEYISYVRKTTFVLNIL